MAGEEEENEEDGRGCEYDNEVILPLTSSVNLSSKYYYIL
jgi:hypothetical protein